MRANSVVATPISSQRTTHIYRTIVQVPVHLIVFQGSMKPLHRVQLDGSSILNASIIEILARIVAKSSRQEAGAVVGDQCRHASSKPALMHRFPPGLLQSHNRIIRRLRSSQVAPSQQITGIVVDCQY